MHGPAETCRIGSEAYELRHDVAVADACETALHLLRGLIGSLEMLGTASGGSAAYQDVASSCAFVARQAAGAIALVAAALNPGE